MATDKKIPSNLVFSKEKFKYNTIQDVINDTGLTVGLVIDINGYYSADDGATHKRVIADSDDGSGVQLRNGLWANIVHNGEVNVSWLGAKGDGVTDDSLAIQKAINNKSKIIFLPKKQYKIDNQIEIVGNGIQIISEPGTRIIISNDGFSIGSKSKKAREIRIYNLELLGSQNTNNVISFIDCANSYFENVAVYKGNTGFAFNDVNRKHFYSCVFNNCSAENQSKNGFDIVHSYEHQVNNLMFISCIGDSVCSNSSDNPQLVPNKEDGNGMLISGCGINIIGGDYSGNAGCGIKVGGYTRGMNITGTYHENNLYKHIDISYNDVFNINISSQYAYSSRNDNKFNYINLPTNSINDSIFKKNINDINLYKQKIPIFLKKDYVNMSNENAKFIVGKEQLIGTNLPCKFTIRVKNGELSGAAIIGTLGIILGDMVYDIVTNCEYKTITQIEGDVITLDSPISKDYLVFGICSAENKMYPIIDTLKKYKIGFFDCSYLEYLRSRTLSTRYYEKKDIGLDTLLNISSIKLSKDMIENNKKIKVGDCLYFSDSIRTVIQNLLSLPTAVNTEKVTNISIPVSLNEIDEKIKSKLCLNIYSNEIADELTCDILSAVTL